MFEQGSLSVKNDLENGGMNLKNTFRLDYHTYVAKGGSIPIFVKKSVMIEIITVLGLKDVGEHQTIVNVLKDKYIWL